MIVAISLVVLFANGLGMGDSLVILVFFGPRMLGILFLVDVLDTGCELVL